MLTALAADLDEGFAVLVSAYQRLIYSIAVRVSGRPAEAEDLASEAFLRAYAALRGYDATRIAALRPRAWLATIVLNVWRNSVRTASRRPRQVPLDNAPDPIDRADSPDQTVATHETGAQLADLLAQLSTAQRAAVVLRHVAGLSTSEVAEALGCPEGTAKSHISRGLKQLRALHPANSLQEALT